VKCLVGVGAPARHPACGALESQIRPNDALRSTVLMRRRAAAHGYVWPNEWPNGPGVRGRSAVLVSLVWTRALSPERPDESLAWLARWRAEGPLWFYEAQDRPEPAAPHAPGPLPYHGGPGMCRDAAQRAKVPAYAQESGFGIRPHASGGFGTLPYRVGNMRPGGLVSGPDMRAYTTAETRIRLHQQRFKLEGMRAYRHGCAICALRERSLVQAAHIVPDVEPEGIAAVVNRLAMCAIHHLAFDRNVLGIDPDGVVHIARRLLEETDGPMLRTGLQGFHGHAIALPRGPEDRPDRLRLESRFARFERAAA
jgi:HNH endonuclease